MTEEQKREAARERMAKARAAKKTQDQQSVAALQAQLAEEKEDAPDFTDAMEAELLGVKSAATMTAQATPSQVLDAEDGLDEALAFAQENTARLDPGAILEVPQLTIDAEQQRQAEFDRLIAEEKQRAARRARMSDQYAAGGALGPVSLYSLENEVDPTRILGADGRSLLEPGEIGELVSLEDTNGAHTMANVHAALARGGRLVQNTDGRYVKKLDCAYVAFKAEDAAAWGARKNAKHYQNPLDDMQAVNLGNGLFAQSAAPEELKFLDDHGAFAEENPKGGRRPVRSGFNVSAEVLPGGDSKAAREWAAAQQAA